MVIISYICIIIAIKTSMRKLSKETELEIKKLLEDNLSIKDIASKLNLCREVIRRRARLLGIKPFSGKSIAYDIKSAPYELQQLVIGSLLGDGSYVRSSSSNSSGCLLSIGHGMSQYSYLKYKFDILDKYDLVNKISIRKYEDSRFKNPNYEECRIKSRTNPLFTKIRLSCYKEGKKYINFDVIQYLDALGLAIWFMDDGYVTNNSCIFSTCSFSIEEQKKLSYFLLGKFGLHFTVGKNDNSMYLKSEDFELFKSIVYPYILPDLQYKLIPYKQRVLYKRGELLEQLNESISSQATEEHKSM